MKTKTLLCTLVVLLTAFATAQPPIDLKPAPAIDGRILPPHVRGRDDFMRRMPDRTTGSSHSTHANTQPSKVNGLIQWQQCLGGTNYDVANSIQQTKDGGYIVAGESYSDDEDVSGNHGGPDYWIVKLSSTGAIQWQQSLGGTYDDFASSIQQTNDGGYIVAGNSLSNDGDVSGNYGSWDYWIVKLSSTGAIQWQNSLGGTSTDFARSIQQTNDGGYIVAGSSGSNNRDVSGNHGYDDYWIVKLSSTGAIQWQKSLGGTGSDRATNIQQTKDGGYIVAGLSASDDGDVSGNHGDDDYWIVKLSSTGAIQWQKSLGGTYSDGAISIQQTKDGGYIVAGWSTSNEGDVSGNHGGYYYGDYWIVKLSSTGTIQWQKCLGGTGDEIAYSIQQTIDGGYIVAGYSESNDGDVSSNHGGYGDYWIVKLGRNGNLQVEESFGGSLYDYGFSGCITTDYGYVVAGLSNSNDGDVSGNHGGFGDYWIVKLKGLKSLLPDVDHATSSDKRTAFATAEVAKPLLHIQPNPSPNGIFTVDIGTVRNNVLISVTNSSGRQVYSRQLAAAQQISIQLSNPPKGIYYLHISYNGGKQTQKLVVQ